MMAMTTRSSIRVKPPSGRRRSGPRMGDFMANSSDFGTSSSPLEGSVIAAEDHLAPAPGAEGAIDRMRGGRLEDPHRAVGEAELDPSRMPAPEAQRGWVEVGRRGGRLIVRRDGAQAPGAVGEGPGRVLVVFGEDLADHEGVAGAVADVRPAVALDVVVPPEQAVAVAALVAVGLAARERAALHPGVAGDPLLAGPRPPLPP